MMFALETFIRLESEDEKRETRSEIRERKIDKQETINEKLHHGTIRMMSLQMIGTSLSLMILTWTRSATRPQPKHGFSVNMKSASIEAWRNVLVSQVIYTISALTSIS